MHIPIIHFFTIHLMLFSILSYVFFLKAFLVFSRVVSVTVSGSNEMILNPQFSKYLNKFIDVSYGLNYTHGMEELWMSPNNYLMLAKNIKDNLIEYLKSKYIIQESFSVKYCMGYTVVLILASSKLSFTKLQPVVNKIARRSNSFFIIISFLWELDHSPCHLQDYIWRSFLTLILFLL